MDTTDLILHSSPFSTTSDPRFFYTNALYEEGYKRLLTALCERKGLLLLTGEPGTGKTTFLQRFSAALDETAHVTFLPCAAPTFQEILSYLCEQCGLSRPGDDQWAQLTLFREYLQERAARGGIEALFIDEAQHLDKETLDRLRLLMNRDGQNEKLLQIILAGQPELEDKLTHPDLRHIQQRIAASCRLLPLVREELGSFIQHRLRVAGYPRLEIFAPEAMQAITHYTGGIPRLINIICDAALLIAARRGLDTVSAEIIVHVAHTLQLVPSPVPRPFREPSSQTTYPVPVGFELEPEVHAPAAALVFAEETYRERTLATQTTLSQPTRTRRRFSFFVPALPQHALGISLSVILVGLSPLLFPSGIGQIDIPPQKTPLEGNLLFSLQELMPLYGYAAVAHYVDPGNVQTMKPLETFPEVGPPSLSLSIPPLFVQSTETHALAGVQQQEHQPSVPLTPTPSSPQSTVIHRPEAAQKQRTPTAAVPPVHEPDSYASDTQSQSSQLPDGHSAVVMNPPFSPPQLSSKVSTVAPSPLVSGSLGKIQKRMQTAIPTLALPWSLGKTEAQARLASLRLTANSGTLLGAAENGSVNTVDLVLKAGVSPNTQNTRGWTALMFASRGNSLDLVELLLARGARPNIRNETGATALIVAARNNRSAIAQALVRRGALIDATDRQGWTALMYAASMGHGVMVRTLLNNGANPRLTNKEGWTASMYAAQGQRISVDPSQFLPNTSERLNRFGRQRQPIVRPHDFDEILTLLKQAEKKQYSRRG